MQNHHDHHHHAPPPPPPPPCNMVRSPIHIPELVEDISQYLRQADVARCARVCKAWQATFVPLLYRHVTHDDNYHVRPTQWTGIQVHSRHMRTLAFTASSFPEETFFGPECRHLTALSIGPLYFVDQPPQWSLQLRSLIDRNPFIHTLRISLQKDLNQLLFREDNILKHVPALKNLTIMMDFYQASSGADSSEVFEAILEVGSQLETLKYEVLGKGSSSTAAVAAAAAAAENPEATSKDTESWKRLSSLTLYDQDGRRGIELLKRSPNVRRLKAVLHRQSCPKTLHQMAHHYSSGHPSCLEHLEVLRVEGSRGQAALEELLRVSAGSSGLKMFSLDLSRVSSTVLTTLLKYHAMSLEKLVEIDSMGLNASDVLLLLTKCSRLKHVEATVWSDGPWLQDIVRSRWACTDLRTFHLKVYPRSMWSSWDNSATGGSNDDSERVPEPRRQFWRQIEALKNLESLRLCLDSTHPLSTELLTIEHQDIEGLCRLRALKELRIPQGNRFMGAAVKEGLLRRRPGLRVFYN